MNKQDEDKFKEVMIGLGEYYSKEITEAFIKIYWYDLKQITLEQFMQAASLHRMNPDSGQFFPKTSDIMKVLVGTSKQQERAIEDRAETQWMTILGEIKRVGTYGSLKLEDKQALAAVKSIGGWQHICSQTESQLVWLHKEFISAYNNFERADVNALPEKLPGRIELENHKKAAQPSIEFQRIKEGIEKHRLENKE